MIVFKKCCDCGLTLPIENFIKKPSCKDGYEPRCRKCRTIKYNKATPERVVKKLYLTQCNNAVIRKMALPTYTYEELLDWVLKQKNFNNIWDNYVKSNYQKDLRPSVDRINNDISYTFSNIQLVTWKDNLNNAVLAKKQGLLGKARKVASYTLDGQLHKIYPNVMSACRDINGKSWGIYTVADKKPVKDGRGYPYTPKTYKGFKWEWID